VKEEWKEKKHEAETREVAWKKRVAIENKREGDERKNEK